MKKDLIKLIVLPISLIFNLFFVFLIIVGSLSKISQFAFFPLNNDSAITSAAIVSLPKGGSAVYNCIEIELAPKEKVVLQFSIFSEKKQSNFILTPLYDPDIVFITNSGYGIEITARKEGYTLIQTLTNDGIRDIALITVK